MRSRLWLKKTLRTRRIPPKSDVGPPPPSIASIAPALGDTAGGTPVTITGTNFSGASGATIGGVAITSFTVVNDTTITGVTGSRALGVVDVEVQHTLGNDALASSFEYWNPSALSKCIFWLRADLGVTESGGRVDSWATQVDASDAGKTVSSTGSNRPARTASHANYNNKPTITTDGASQRLLPGGTLGGTWAASAEAQPNECFFVGHMPAATTSTMLEGEASGNRHYMRADSGGTNKWQVGTSSSLTSTINITAPAMVSTVYNTTSSAIYSSDSDTANVTGNVGSAHTLDSCHVFVNGTGSFNAPSGTNMAEIAYFNAALTNAERLKLFQYAGQRYALPWS